MIIASGNNPAVGLTTGNLTSLLAYCMNILMSLMMLSMVFVMVTMSMASAERVAEVINEKADITAGRHLHGLSGDSSEEELYLQILRFCPWRPLL